MNIADLMNETPIVAADLSRFVTVDAATPVSAVVASMNDDGQAAAFVLRAGRLAGVFTDRDVLNKVAADRSTWEVAVADIMTTEPLTVLDTDSVADGLAAMAEHWVRNLPVVTAADDVVGNFSAGALLGVTAVLLGQEPAEKEPEASVQHGLEFIDLTGLTTRKPVAVLPTAKVGDAMHQMTARGIGSVVVVDERGHVVGVFTEFDVLAKLACREVDLQSVPVGTYMTKDPITLSPRRPIAAAIHAMAQHEFSHVPLIGESGRPVGMISARDMADFLVTSVAALG